MTTLAELPFHARPAHQVLALDRDADPDYDGYGWTRVDRLWLSSEHGWRCRLDDALILAIHAADDGAALTDDVELDFAVGQQLLRTRATAFLAAWLPRLPPVPTVVLAMCNPHRAVLPRVAGAAGGAMIHYAAGDVFAWLDPGDRIRLAAEAWRTVPGAMTELTVRPGAAISDEDKQTYIGLYLLKKLDLKPKDGGITIPIVLPTELSPLDDTLQQLAVDEYIVMNNRKNCWELTKKGIAYLREHIDEATELIDEFDDHEVEDMLAELRARNLDPFRARFLWAWYDGEIDDLVLYQERRGIRPVERMWALYLTGDEFWNDLARELDV